ncbi:hypothetical protein [Desulfosporosinus lacus]|uniref:Uncharacterized protein n=1 Tax=Desulfosporosinus lacus DSM 15449 TaxID=1121420 RepID=A0A1M5VKQ4_9FIRM|nr:hypothetical protein [Desulfosporosinus lacus]MDA8228512.1 hypothetical protein [Desulfitobacterium hafniense]SHH75805.1 hypothetical protein SAMN02746098_01389 [Desulfosporosinus lacus DSM 15449]
MDKDKEVTDQTDHEGVRVKMSALKVNPTPVIKGKYVQDILTEIKRKPSQKAIERNERAYALLNKLRKGN